MFWTSDLNFDQQTRKVLAFFACKIFIFETRNSKFCIVIFSYVKADLPGQILEEVARKGKCDEKLLKKVAYLGACVKVKKIFSIWRFSLPFLCESVQSFWKAKVKFRDFSQIEFYKNIVRICFCYRIFEKCLSGKFLFNSINNNDFCSLLS
jgi:hypothetical protein